MTRPARAEPLPGLVADVGGTNARFALTDAPFDAAHVTTVKAADHHGLGEALAAYLAGRGRTARPPAAAVAVACPVAGDRVALTNSPWSFSIADLRAGLGLDRLEVVNDFAAIALAIPHLADEDSDAIGGGAALARAPIGVLGPGTGLGVSALVPARDGGWVAVASEGGHATMAPADERESAVLSAIRRRLGHVSAERVISGPGLVNIYRAVAELAGRTPEPLPPDEVTARGLAGTCPLAAEALAMFMVMLGTVAGNLALTLGAKGGIFIGGGIVPRLGEAFAGSAFRERFEDKGRFRAYLAEIPTRVIRHPFPALVGLKALLAEPPR
ncbi:MAG: glucokinase [Proteobacteria bacterium]|nr:glucokinase [Pseudomonadota bacterium]